jgi:uncharacterized protein YbjT (DUF2867 family)
MNTKSILVTTPTGNIGRGVVRGLLKEGINVRVIARDPARLDPDDARRIEVFQGSTDDPSLLERALKGAQALFWCTPPTEAVDVIGHYTRFAQAAAQAIHANGTPRVVTISSGGKGLAGDAGPISGLHAMEDVIDTTDAAVRHLRCGDFMENFIYQVNPMVNAGAFYYPMRGDVPMPMVTTKDIAAVAVMWLRRDDWTGQAGIGVQGPADLSMDQAAMVFSKVLERPVQFHGIPVEAYRASMLKNGSSEGETEALIKMWAAVESGIYRAEPRTLETTTPTTLEVWATEHLKPLIQK